MRSETAYEVYSYGDRRWIMEARFAAEAKNDAYVLANELRRQSGIEMVRIVREIWDPRSNGFSEVTIYEVRGPGRGERANQARRAVFGGMLRPAPKPSDTPAPKAPGPDPTFRILGKLMLIAVIALAAAAAAAAAGQTFWSVAGGARIGLFLAVLCTVLGIGAAIGMSRAEWRALIDENPQQQPGVRKPTAANGTGGAHGPAGAGEAQGASATEPQAAVEPPPPPPRSDQHVRAEVRILDFLQRSLADPRLTREERGSFQAFVFTIGAVDALAREDGLDRPAKTALLETCGIALGIDAATVAHTLANLARTVSRSDGLALAQAGMRAMLDRLDGRPYAHGLADALAAQNPSGQADAAVPAQSLAISVGLIGLDQPGMADTRKRITDMVAYHRGYGLEFSPDMACACFDRHTEALITALALAAVLQPAGGTRGRPRFGLGDTMGNAVTAMAAAEPGEIVGSAVFDSAIRVGLGEDLPPGYRALEPDPPAEEEEPPLLAEREIFRTPSRVSG